MPLNKDDADNLHPGNVLREDYMPDLEERGVTRYKVAKELHITQSQLDALLAGKRNVTANMALRLGRFFNQSPEMWLSMQNKYDISIARLEFPDIEGVKPFDFGGAGKPDNDLVAA